MRYPTLLGNKRLRRGVPHTLPRCAREPFGNLGNCKALHVDHFCYTQGVKGIIMFHAGTRDAALPVAPVAQAFEFGSSAGTLVSVEERWKKLRGGIM